MKGKVAKMTAERTENSQHTSTIWLYHNGRLIRRQVKLQEKPNWNWSDKGSILTAKFSSSAANEAQAAKEKSSTNGITQYNTSTPNLS